MQEVVGFTHSPPQPIENAGNIVITGGGSTGLGVHPGTTFTNSGSVTISGTASSSVSVTFGSFINTGTLRGTGQFSMEGSSLSGIVAPGTSTGIMSFPASQVFTASNSMEIEINGTMS